MEKSTIKTSRKIHALKYGGGLITIITLTYCLINFISPDTLGGGVIIAAVTAIGAIISSLNFADGIKGHEAKDNDSRA